MGSTVAEQLVEILEQAEVRRIYGVVGDSLNPVVDAVRRSSVEWVNVRNEEGGAFAAAAEAQLTGRLAVCAGSCGPGNTHLLQGLYDAHRSGAPVLALASQIPSEQIGTGYFQETHPERLFVECSHFCELLSGPAQMPRMARTAIQHATGLGGVAVLVVPGDVAHQRAVHDTGRTDTLLGPAPVVPTAEQVQALAEAVNTARTVTLFCGAGTRGAHGEVMELATRLQAPIGHTLRGKEWIQFDNPFDVGMTGLLGYGACYQAMHEADLLLLLGTDFPYDTFLPQAHTIQIDRDPARLGRRTLLELAVHGDVRETLRGVLPLIEQKTSHEFLASMLHRHERALRTAIDAYTRDLPERTPIHPEYVAAVLDDLAADDAVFTVDTGLCNVWAARYLTPNGRRRVIGSFRHGSMANALPHAIGAQAADRGRQVVSMSGDGGLSMLLGELLTVRQHDLPLTTVVFNNSALGLVRLEMLVDGLPFFGTDNGTVDYAALARAAGIPAARVDKPGELRGAIGAALGHDGPYLVDVVTDPDALSLPPHITAAEVKGFALASSKIVLQGGVGTMIELARANLRNIRAL